MSTGNLSRPPTARVAPERTATPQPARRMVAPRRAIGQAITGTAAVAVSVGLFVAPIAVFALGGLSLALLFLLVGVPALNEAQHGRLADTLSLAAAGAGSVGLGLAIGGLAWVASAPSDLEHLALTTRWILLGCTGSLALAVIGAGLSLRLRAARAEPSQEASTSWLSVPLRRAA